MAEYDDVESALRALEIDEAADDGGRPVVRSVSESMGNRPSKTPSKTPTTTRRK
jgi:hypothetical protein